MNWNGNTDPSSVSPKVRVMPRLSLPSFFATCFELVSATVTSLAILKERTEGVSYSVEKDYVDDSKCILAEIKGEDIGQIYTRDELSVETDYSCLVKIRCQDELWRKNRLRLIRLLARLEDVLTDG